MTVTTHQKKIDTSTSGVLQANCTDSIHAFWLSIKLNTPTLLSPLSTARPHRIVLLSVGSDDPFFIQ